MRFRAMIALLASAGAMVAAEFSATGVKLPVFDAQDRLVRRLVAESAEGAAKATALHRGRVEFFDASSATAPRATLTFARAFYEADRQTIRDDGAIQLVAPDGNLAATGYLCRLETAVLELTSDVRVETADFAAAARSAIVHYDASPEEKKSFIREARLAGEVVIVTKNALRERFERLATSEAIYDGASGVLRLRKPVSVWKDGQRAELDVNSEFFEILLSDSHR